MTIVQYPFHDIASHWKPPRLSSLPSWADAKRVAVDIETCDPTLNKLGPGVRRDGFIAGVAFAIENGPCHYLPIGHLAEPETNLPKEHVLQYLRDQAEVFKGDIVGANLSYDLDYLAEAGVIFRKAMFRDVINASVLIYELHPRNSLNHCLARAGLEPKREESLELAAKAWCLKPKSDIWKMPPRHVAVYAMGDVELPLQLLRRQEREFSKQDLWRIWHLESQVLPITVKIRRHGVRIDVDRLDQVCDWALAEQTKLLGNVKHQTGIRIDPKDMFKAKLIARAVESIGVKLPRTAKGFPRTNAKTLMSIPHDVPHWILRAKKFHKMRTSAASSIREHMIGDRIHSTFQQVKGSVRGKQDEKGAAYGRFSSIDPNLQQQYNPEKEPEISAIWRRIFIPEDGSLWAACDYSAQEPRMLVHYAYLSKCRGASAIVDRYRENPNMDLHQATADLCGITRKEAKIIFLGLCYGMGGAKLCDDLGLPTTWWRAPDGKDIRVADTEGRALLDQFNAMVPFVKKLSKMCMTRAERVGFIRTLLGRRCRFFRQPNGEYESTYKAINRLIQGSSADQGKQALIDAEAAGFYIHIPVHDELTASVPDRKTAERLGEVMVNAVRLEVPSAVDVEVGSSWGTVA